MRAWLVILLMVPVAAGQGHTHAMGSGFAVVTDLGPEGIAHVGSPVHFELIAFGDDLVPDFHQDLPVRVTLGGDVLYETTTVSGHDYDGVHGFDIVFPQAGTWRVAVLADGEEVAWREGEVLDVPLSGWGGNGMAQGPSVGVDPFEFQLDTSSSGERAEHSDLLLEVFQEGRLVFRTHLHIHDEPATFVYRPDQGIQTSAQVTRYTAFPTNGSASLNPASTVLPIPLNVAVPLPSAPLVASELPAKNDATVVDTDRYTLIGTYDPFTQVGPDTLQHLNVLVMDPNTGMPVQHVDFEATLSGPPGLIFQSSSLHEYDGIYTLETRQRLPGQYVLDVTASRGDWSADIQLGYYVLPPVVATLAGPQTIALDRDAFATGEPTPFAWSIADLAGRPFAHGEVDLRIVRPGDAGNLVPDVVYVRDKLHTHGDGKFPVTYAFPEAGDWPLLTDPFPLDPQPVGPFTYNTIQSGAGYVVTVTGEAPHAPDPPVDVSPTAEAPLPLAVLVVALLASLAARKR